MSKLNRQPGQQAQALLDARSNAEPVSWQEILPASRAEAFRIQDETMAQLGSVGGWKVGAKGPAIEPICAPLPAGGVLASGIELQSSFWPLRGIEVELALRLGQDLVPGTVGSTIANVWSAFDAIFPALEIVETRLVNGRQAPPLAQLADLQSHGALVLGSPQPMPPEGIELPVLHAQLNVDGNIVASMTGGNPAGDLARLLIWLATHCHERGHTLKAGQIITTGSCTGMYFAPSNALLKGAIRGQGDVVVAFLDT